MVLNSSTLVGVWWTIYHKLYNRAVQRPLLEILTRHSKSNWLIFSFFSGNICRSLFLICVHSWQAASVYWGNELQTMQWTSGGAGPLFHRAGRYVVKYQICRAAVDHWPLTWRLTVHKRNTSIVRLLYHFLFFDLSLMIVGLSSWLMNNEYTLRDIFTKVIWINFGLCHNCPIQG